MILQKKREEKFGKLKKSLCLCLKPTHSLLIPLSMSALYPLYTLSMLSLCSLYTYKIENDEKTMGKTLDLLYGWHKKRGNAVSLREKQRNAIRESMYCCKRNNDSLFRDCRQILRNFITN